MIDHLAALSLGPVEGPAQSQSHIRQVTASRPLVPSLRLASLPLLPKKKNKLTKALLQGDWVPPTSNRTRPPPGVVRCAARGFPISNPEPVSHAGKEKCWRPPPPMTHRQLTSRTRGARWQYAAWFAAATDCLSAATESKVWPRPRHR